MKTLIAVPCMDSVAAGFAQNLAALNKKGDCVLSFMANSLIYDSRNKLAAQAISCNADYIMWFDSDMTFPADTLEKMLKHMEDGKDIVTGVYYRRLNPYTPVLFSEHEIIDGNTKSKGYDDYPEDELFEVAGAGFGCLCMKTSIATAVLINYGAMFDPLGHSGEDLAFLWRARQLGYKVWCDPSIQCGHIGSITVNKAFYEALKK